MSPSAEAARPTPDEASHRPATEATPATARATKTTAAETAEAEPFPPLDAQAERLIELGVHELAGLTADRLRRLAADLTAEPPASTPTSGAARSGSADLTAEPPASTPTSGAARSGSAGHSTEPRRPSTPPLESHYTDGLLAVHPSLVPVRELATLMTHRGKPGFVVVDMSDLEEFVPLPGMELPDLPLYVVRGIERGDEMRNWSPEEALDEIVGRGRTPLTIAEGVSWLLQQPRRLEPNHCFMCIGSRKPTARGLDARTPAIWISGGTGRDGRERRNAPKVGWCWARNRHTWLGFASAAGRGRAVADAE